MVNLKLGEEIRKDGIFNMSRAWDKEKSESPTGIEPMTFRTPVGRSNHWATVRLVASIGHIYWVRGDIIIIIIIYLFIYLCIY